MPFHLNQIASGPMSACFSCGKALDPKVPVGRRDSCEQCGSDLRCCRNCAFYDPRVAHECREPVAERVKEKDRSNFCDHFQLSDGEPEKLRDEASEAKRRLEALFKKQGAS